MKPGTGGDGQGRAGTGRVSVRRADGTVVALADLADTWWRRLRGLLGRPPLAEGEGLLLVPCRAVHMLGMRYPIDVAFLDGEGLVVAVHPSLEPGARTEWHRSAEVALEVPAGTLGRAAIRPGDRLEWREVE